MTSSLKVTGPQKLVEVVGLSGSIVLAAGDPAALAVFYAALLEVEATPGLGPSHWRVPWPAGGQLEIYAPSRSRPSRTRAAGWPFASSGSLRGEMP